MAGFSKAALDLTVENWADVERYNGILDRLLVRRKTSVAVVGFLRESKTAWKCSVLQQSLLYRMTMLASGCADMWNAGNVICAILSARALVETISLSHFVADTLQKYLDEKNIDAIEDVLNHQLFSTRDEKRISDGVGYQARSILTFIDKFNKQIDGVREAYDFLSEFCHPNGSGHLFTYGEIDTRTGAVKFSEATPRVLGIQGHVVTCFMLTAFVEPMMDIFDRVIPLVCDMDLFKHD